MLKIGICLPPEPVNQRATAQIYIFNVSLVSLMFASLSLTV